MGFSLRKCGYAHLAARRDAYLATIDAPLDGMWENAFFQMAEHWEIVQGGHVIGYCAVNSERAMLGFVAEEFALRKTAFAYCLETLQLAVAFVSTAEPVYLVQCMDHQASMSVNALMYEEGADGPIAPVFPPEMDYRLVEHDELEAGVAFGIAAIGADSGWLTGYYRERIERGELFGLWRDAELVATAELRLSPNQGQIADLGMIVGAAYRRQGLGTRILQKLREDGRRKGLALICSTEQGNIGAQIAIQNAGFVSRHSILKFTF